MTASFKPLNFACMLKLSTKQLKERAFQDGTMDQVGYRIRLMYI
jgi:hypothetical protein